MPKYQLKSGAPYLRELSVASTAPEAALSPSRQFAFLRVLRALDKAGRAQVIMATHLPILMAYPDAQLLYIENGSVKERSYEETAHFKTMKQFIGDPAQTLAELFAEK